MQEITAKQLEDKLAEDNNLPMIDVREDEEVAQGKIPGSIHIPLGELEERTNELDQTITYYVICRSGGRSGAACNFLNEKGYKAVNISGGMLEWDGAVE